MPDKRIEKDDAFCALSKGASVKGSGGSAAYRDEDGQKTEWGCVAGDP